VSRVGGDGSVPPPAVAVAGHRAAGGRRPRPGGSRRV